MKMKKLWEIIKNNQNILLQDGTIHPLTGKKFVVQRNTLFEELKEKEVLNISTDKNFLIIKIEE